MKFEIRNIEIFLHLGVTEDERTTLQRVLISLTWNADTAKSEQSDNIEDTTDYFAIRECVTTFLQEKSFSLLEKLHHETLSTLQNYFPELKNVKMTIEKFPFESGSVVVGNE